MLKFVLHKLRQSLGLRSASRKQKPARSLSSVRYFRPRVEGLEDRVLPSVSAIGGEVRINTTTANTQENAAIAMDDSGDYVVVWSGKGASDYDIYGQRYNAAGTAVGSEFVVNSTTAGDQKKPGVAMDSDGDFVATWWFKNSVDGNYEIYARRFNAAGTPFEVDFRVNTTVSSNKRINPTVAVDADGDRVVFAWQSDQGGTYDIFARRYNAQDNTFYDAGEVAVLNATAGTQKFVDVAIDADGDRVVFAWEDNRSGNYDIYARRYNSQDNTFYEAEFTVTTDTNVQKAASVALDSDGDKTVFAWESTQGGTYDVYARRYDAVAHSFPAAEFLVNNSTTNVQRLPSVAVDDDGDFAVGWKDSRSGTYDVYARMYNSAGTAQGYDFLVNTTTANIQKNPALAMDSSSRLAIAWDGEGSGDTAGIFGQFHRYYSTVSAVGGETRVNTTTTDIQSNAATAMDDAGNFVVVWADRRGGANYDIWGQRYNAGGVAQGVEFQINTLTGVDKLTPSVALDADGDFIVAWQSASTTIHARRYDSAGTAIDAAEFQVNVSTGSTRLRPKVAVDSDRDYTIFAWDSNQGGTFDVFARRYNALTNTFYDASDVGINATTSLAQQEVSVAIDADGDQVIFAWQSNQVSGYDVYGRRYNAQTGSFPGGEFVVSSSTNDQLNPSVGIDADGSNVVFAWHSMQGGNNDIYVRRYNNLTDAFGAEGEFLAHGTLASSQTGVALGVDDSGDFTVAWTSDQGGTNDVYARAFTANGAALTSEFVVNATTTLSQANAAVAMSSRSDFVVAWDGDGPGDTAGVFRQLYRRDPLADAGEIAANTVTANHQRLSTIAAETNGDFVVAWMSLAQDGDSYGIYAQRYNAAGTALGVEFRVNFNTTGAQLFPQAAMDDDGDFVIVWTSNHGVSGTNDIYYRRYNSAGVAQDADDVIVNTTTGSNQTHGTVAMDSAGNFVVSWSSLGQDVASTWGIYAQRFNAAGVAQGSEDLVNTTTAGDQHFSSVAMDAAGNYVVAWVHNFGTGSDIYLQRFDSAGNELGVETTVSAAGNTQHYPSVARDRDGDFVVAWMSDQPGATSYDIYALRYDAAGVAQGSEFVVNTTLAGEQLWPSVALDGDGDFVVTMTGDTDNADGRWGVYARRYRSTGVAYGAQFQINTYTLNDQYASDAAMSAAGDFTLTWTSGLDQDGSGEGIYAQRFTAASAASFPAFVTDGNESAGAANIQLEEAQALVASNYTLIWGDGQTSSIASLDTGIDYTHPALYQNIWLNAGEIPFDILAQLTDVDGDGLITFRDLNKPVNQGAGRITDLNGTGFIDGGDLLYSRALGGWADGHDNDGNGYTDDLIGWDFANNDNNPFDDNGHGTHDAGVVAQVNPYALLMPLKFLDGNGQGYVLEAQLAMDYALRQGAPISLGAWSALSFSPDWLAKLQEAQAAGHVFVVAAGNNDPALLDALAGFHLDNVVVVAASGADDRLASFTNAGASVVDLAAPGVGVLSSVPGVGYAARSGSSIAAAFVAGAMGLLKADNPTLHYREALDALYSSTDPVVDGAAGVKYGRLNVLKAVIAAQQYKEVTILPAAAPNPGFTFSPLLVGNTIQIFNPFGTGTSFADLIVAVRRDDAPVGGSDDAGASTRRYISQDALAQSFLASRSAGLAGAAEDAKAEPLSKVESGGGELEPADQGEGEGEGENQEQPKGAKDGGPQQPASKRGKGKGRAPKMPTKPAAPKNEEPAAMMGRIDHSSASVGRIANSAAAVGRIANSSAAVGRIANSAAAVGRIASSPCYVEGLRQFLRHDAENTRVLAVRAQPHCAAADNPRATAVADGHDWDIDAQAFLAGRGADDHEEAICLAGDELLAHFARSIGREVETAV